MASKMPIFENLSSWSYLCYYNLGNSFIELRKPFRVNLLQRNRYKKSNILNLKSMNNTKPNGLQNTHISKISLPGPICANKIRKTASCSLEGPLESIYSKETVKRNQ